MEIMRPQHISAVLYNTIILGAMFSRPYSYILYTVFFLKFVYPHAVDAQVLPRQCASPFGSAP
jgi:hypothetical protein